jgi:hypothetical protein
MAILTLIAWFSLGIAFVCAFVIALDEIRHPQQMWIMNLVWPITALYLSVLPHWARHDNERHARHVPEPNEATREHTAGPGARANLAPSRCL